ncbi:MAG: hypothetical protein HQ592_11400 [Planctomycetes bacterium]|nr:hypothetical protein [Planctomycetota bacterium]
MYVILNSNWCIARDPDNRGRAEEWSASVRGEAEPAPVPGIIQQVFPNYHGVAWYWTRFTPSRLPEAGERVMLRFGAVDYLAEVWVNGVAVGGHEGGETPFELDVTDAVHADENLLAVRVLNPTNEPIDGIVLAEIPHRNRRVPHQPGSSYNAGGILLPVEALVVPAVRVADVFAQPDWRTGEVQLAVVVCNDTGETLHGRLEATIGPQLSGDTQATASLEADCPPGESQHTLHLCVDQPRLWSLDDPCLYLLSVDLNAEAFRHRRAVRIGFRDFRVEDGWFILNGKRLFLKSTHTCNHFPIGQIVPPTADMMRRDLVYAKACGYNCVRFIAHVAWPEQLDFCDEIGLMVHEECLAGWCLKDSPKMVERFDRSVREMILRDRNHPSVTIWGFLNETNDGPVFRRAVEWLPLARELDPTRLVLLGSGRWDGQLSIGSLSNPPGAQWEHQWGGEAPDALPSPFPPLEPCPYLANMDGGYVKDVGDAHVYPCTPQTAEATAFVRNLGRDMKPVFLSEYGIGSLMDVIGETRKYEEAGCRADLYDYAFIRGMAEKLEADWKRWGFEGTYPFAEDMLRDSQRLHMRQRRLGFDLIRSNPRLCGYNLTGMLDHGITGEGVWTFWRELKPLAADTLRDGWAPLRWCLFVTPSHGYTGRPLELEAVLANEDVLPPGDYPVTFRITGAQGIVWEQSSTLNVPEPPDGEHGPLAIPTMKTSVQLDVPPGEYVFAARLDRGGAPAGDRMPFTLSATPVSLPTDARTRVTTWGLENSLEHWLEGAGLQIRRLEDAPARFTEVILIGLPQATREQWVDLARRIARGGVAVFLQPEAYRCDEDKTFWLPLARKGECLQFHDWLYHKECVAKRHPIFDGLQTGGVLDWDYYDQVIGHGLFVGQDTPDEVVCAAFAPCTTGAEGGYLAGTMIAAHRLGAGVFILNTLNIVEQVDKHPAADRLLLNLIRYAHTRRQSRLVKLPADFNNRLNAELYPPRNTSSGTSMPKER